MSGDLSGQRAFVTGGSLGIGRAIALELARSGADVAFSYLGGARPARELLREIRSLGRRGLSFHADAASFPETVRSVGRAVKEWGGMEVLVNNAGIALDGVIWKMRERQWDRVLAVNLKGCYNHIRALAPHFKRQGYGKIVNISSINALRGKFGQANYCASKAGIIGLTKAVARELGPYGVCVNCIAPGMIETEMTSKLPSGIRTAAAREAVLGRLGKPEDVAQWVVFLCGQKAGHVTGQVIRVDGGQYL